ncbi:Aspartic proteinase-like protein 2 [Camellia lanceoleosa]|uniref:Aspartic proteinase-like protein 2 n=1 Tax=Camellia lanceoleosa TaxID=1840588 RepID=A0ACC0HJL2_9ERIC|nr:Aspartic proteinase-like protein 2 [Camellia lanceoleosa]
MFSLVSSTCALLRCGAKQSGQLGSSSQALDGILGFGQANSSMISQLASVGKVKKMFAHCLDGTNGGGIFAIGQLAIEVGRDVLQLPTDVLDSQSGKAVVIDSGTTLAYLADDMEKIMATQPDLKLHTVEQQFTCFQFNGNVDNGFPAVNFRFENSLSLTSVCSEYLFQIRDNVWCVGWQNGGMQSKDGNELTLLGGFIGIGPVL